jgi:ATP-dependent Lhr-like helicase
MAQQLLSRHGIVTRETVASEAVAGGFSAVYEVLKAMEDAGRVRRGYFVAGLGAAQFALPPALDLLRSMREVPETPRTVVLAATDPANPYGGIIKWPETGDAGRGPTRTVGALVILVDGAASAYLRRGERELLLFAPEAEPQRSRVIREVARMLLHLAARRGMLISEINNERAETHGAARLLVQEGFVATAMGLQARTDRIKPRGYGSLDSTGIGIAATRFGGDEMAEERVRSSNDMDQQLEREGVQPKRNRGYDEAANSPRGGRDVDPDRPDAGVDRDDIGTA